MKTEKPKYKIVTRWPVWASFERYYVYRRCFFGLLWKRISVELSMRDAEVAVKRDKIKQEARAKHPLVEYR
jgi:hypothetical protein